MTTPVRPAPAVAPEGVLGMPVMTAYVGLLVPWAAWWANWPGSWAAG
jgi:hypothetical protein